MKTINIPKALCLHESEGWFYVPFNDGSEESFYTTMIENSEISLAWVAKCNKVNTTDLAKHHFVREELNGTGLSNFTPRLLIVTDGWNWYASKIGSKEFFKTSYPSVLMMMHDQINSLVKSNESDTSKEKLITKFKNSMEKIRKQVRLIGLKQSELTPQQEDKLFANAEPDIDDSYKAMYEVGLMRSNVIEKMLDSKSVEAHDFALMIHYYLSNFLNDEQINALLKINRGFIYINPWYKGNQLLLKVCPIDIYLKRDKRKKLDSVYLLMQENGQVEQLEFSTRESLKELHPGFFKLNQKMLHHYRNKTNE